MSFSVSGEPCIRSGDRDRCTEHSETYESAAAAKLHFSAIFIQGNSDYTFRSPRIGPEKLIRGVAFSEVPLHEDERGALLALDHNQSLPFEIKRCFFIWGCPPLGSRAGHSISADIGLLALRGSAIVDLDNGAEKVAVELSEPRQLLCVHAGVWLRLRGFSADAIIGVAASRLYSETEYFPVPRPDLQCAGPWRVS